MAQVAPAGSADRSYACAVSEDCLKRDDLPDSVPLLPLGGSRNDAAAHDLRAANDQHSELQRPAHPREFRGGESPKIHGR
jgi:hypothetical protein